jgi:hypothetical protein
MDLVKPFPRRGLLVWFAAGVLVSNTFVAAVSTVGLRGLAQRRRVYLALSVLTAFLSLSVGTLFLLRRSGSLPRWSADNTGSRQNGIWSAGGDHRFTQHETGCPSGMGRRGEADA